MSFLAEKRCVGHNKTEFRGYKKSPARRLQQGAVSDKQPVSTGCGRESVTKWSGIYKKGAPRL
jgi:hypothetical protein